MRHAPGAITTGLTVILHHQSWRNILTYAGTIAELNFGRSGSRVPVQLPPLPFFVVLSAARARPEFGELFQFLKSKGLTISLDTNDDPEDRWEGNLKHVLQYVDVFLPNEREACKAAGTEDLEAAIRKLSDLVPLLVVKMGRQGAIAQRGSERFTSAAKLVDAVDPVGAGDSFDAGFLHEYVRGADIRACLASGNLAGASPQHVPEERKRSATLSTGPSFSRFTLSGPMCAKQQHLLPAHLQQQVILNLGLQPRSFPLLRLYAAV